MSVLGHPVVAHVGRPKLKKSIKMARSGTVWYFLEEVGLLHEVLEELHQLNQLHQLNYQLVNCKHPGVFDFDMSLICQIYLLSFCSHLGRVNIPFPSVFNERSKVAVEFLEIGGAAISAPSLSRRPWKSIVALCPSETISSLFGC